MIKRVLITGAKSYIGESFLKYSSLNPELIVTELDVKTPSWVEHDFSNYDTIVHVAAIVHSKHVDIPDDLYYQVNTRLVSDVALKAKESGVSQFIFMSSMSVYGEKHGRVRIITKDTIPSPTEVYGDSKYRAEKLLEELESEDFKVSILRPPMVYGPGAKGNYTRLSKLVKKIPVFPKVFNQRSMIFIDNLCEFIYQIILLEKSGIYLPQNKDYVCTSQLVREIARVNNKKVYLIPGFSKILSSLFFIPALNKLFGNLTYVLEDSRYDFDYQKVDFVESIKIAESQIL